MSVFRNLIFLLLVAALGVAQENPGAKPADNPPPSSVKSEAPASSITKSSEPAPPDAKSRGAKPAEVTASDKPTTLSQEQIRDLIRLCAENDLKNDKLLRDYTYTERQETRHIGGKGQVKSTETETYDMMEIYGEPVQKLVAKNDKPLPAKDAQKEDEKIQKLIDKRKDESDGERKKRLAKEEKDREQERQFVREVADAYNFKFIGTETLNGRDNYVIDGDPKPGYQPVHREAKILPKMRFRVWIDRADSQVAKLDVECIDTVSFGLFLARLHKGSRVVLEQVRVNDEVWLQQHVAVKVDARIALLKDFDIEVDVSDRDYKKFRTDSKIVGVGELQSQ
ncbi:MAG: hypothetical protein WBW69_12695 [Candidatus Korobacteraceae bacterium]